MFSLEVMIPAAVSQGDLKISQPAPRPASLNGKTVGLLWNDKRGGDVALQHLGGLLQKRYHDLKINFYKGPRGYPRPLLEKALAECDLFLGSTGD